MTISELIQHLEIALELEGDIEVGMDIADEDAVFYINQVLIEIHQDKIQKRLLLCNDYYVKPTQWVVK